MVKDRGKDDELVVEKKFNNSLTFIFSFYFSYF